MTQKEINKNTDQLIVIFCDGASIGNPGPGGYGAIIIKKSNIKDQNEMYVTELGGRSEHTTNNRMELMAAIKGLESLSGQDSAKSHPIKIHTDSSYVINGITKWVFSWERRNWVTMNKEPVLNKDLWEELLEQTKNRQVEWVHVAGHSGIPGNERVDEIAGGFASGKTQELFSGDFKDYKIKDIFDLKAQTSSKKKSKNRTPKIGYYLSKVDTKVMTHDTWEECKKRVLGVKKAKFKKVANQEEEREVLKGWG